MGARVAKIKLRYVDEYIDRTGKLRRYFRKGGKRIGQLVAGATNGGQHD